MKKYSKITIELNIDDLKAIIKNHITSNENVTLVNSTIKDNLLVLECVGGKHNEITLIDIPIQLATGIVKEEKKNNRLPDEIRKEIELRFSETKLSSAVYVEDLYTEFPQYRRQMSAFIVHSDFYKHFDKRDKYKYVRISEPVK